MDAGEKVSDCIWVSILLFEGEVDRFEDELLGREALNTGQLIDPLPNHPSVQELARHLLRHA